MEHKLKTKFYNLLLSLLLTCIFLANISTFISCEAASTVTTSPKHSDSSEVSVFLDTTVLGSFFFPVKGKVISHFGKRGGRMHTGTDIKLANGDTVRASFTGVVTKSTTYYGYGILVVLKHPGNLETYYAHLSKALVNDGDTIAYGTPLGLGGRTGKATTDHLHFEIRKNGRALNSEHFFNFNDLSIKSLVLLNNSEIPERKVEKASRKKKHSAVTKSQTKIAVNKDIAVKYHTIKKGDTLFSLSRKYGTTVDKICKLNKINKSDLIMTGQKLRVL